MAEEGTAYPPTRALTDQEFGLIGRAMLLWGYNEQHIGSIAASGHEVRGESAAVLVHPLPYGKKVDLACDVLAKSDDIEQQWLAKELDFIRRSFRPERDTIAHGAFGTWVNEAWVRSLSKPRFVMADDFGLFLSRAAYSFSISLESLVRQQGGTPVDTRRPRPDLPTGKKPTAWSLLADNVMKAPLAARRE